MVSHEVTIKSTRYVSFQEELTFRKSNCSLFQEKDIPATASLLDHIKILKVCVDIKKSVGISGVHVDDDCSSCCRYSRS